MKKVYEKYFDTTKTKFDRLNCSFALHYFLKDADSWRNFKSNVNNHLRDGGYFTFEVFDADKIVDVLKESGVYTVYYTTERGEKKILFEIKRNKDYGEKPYKCGNSLDVHAAWLFDEGRYETEYLVDKDYITDDLMRDCNLELIDTNTFENLYEIHREMFLNYSQYDDPKTSAFFKDVKSFYDHNEINGGCYKFSRLARYYVFRKKDGATRPPRTASTLGKVPKQKGGGNLLKDKSLIVKDLEYKTNNNTFVESLFDIFLSQKIIPSSMTLKELKSDLDLNFDDSKITNDSIYNMCKKIVIKHDIKDPSGSKKAIKIIDGLNTVLIEKDCNGQFDVDYIEDAKNNKSIVLYRDNNKFKPIYQKMGNKYQGLFNNNDSFIYEFIQLQ